MARIAQSKLPDVKRYYQDMNWSMREIAEELGVGLNAVYYFMRKNNLERRSRTETNKLLFQRKKPSFNIPTGFTKEQHEILLIGVSLYWSEGAKRGNVVDFANSDVRMCVIFMRFLREVCRIEESRLRLFLYCHHGQDVNTIIAFWSKTLRIPKEQFTKPYVRKKIQSTTSINPRPHRMEYGVIHIRYGDLKLLHVITTWIEEIIIMGRFQSGQMGQTVKRQLPIEMSG